SGRRAPAVRVRRRAPAGGARGGGDGVMTPRLVVVGDALLDRDLVGTVDRVAPDAPVPVLAATESMDRPGGAALAAALATDLGVEVTLVAPVPDDAGGTRLRALLDDAGVRLCALPVAGPMPEKIRIRAGGHMLMRVDQAGAPAPVPEKLGREAVTRGADGALAGQGAAAPLMVPAPPVHGGDPCGAGDRFAAAVSAALTRGEVLSEAVAQAVVAASAYVGAGGAAAWQPGGPGRPPERAAIGLAAAHAVARATRLRGGTVVATGGCFDLLHVGHLSTLRAARKLGDCLIVCLN